MAPEVFNCSAPDTGNMEVLERYGTPELKEQWLKPLLAGEIRSCFAMTEPAVASSDATNIESSIVREGDHYVINGRKWWSSGAGDPRCKVAIFMGKTRSDRAAPSHQQQSMMLCRWTRRASRLKRMLTVFGYDHAPHGHGEILFENVRVPVCEACCSAKDEALRSRRAGWGRGAFITACAASAWRSARLKPCASGCKSRVAFGNRWRNREPYARISRDPAWRSNRHAC